MIEKLPNFDSTEASIYHVEKLYAKVNQLVEAVNVLQESMDLVQSTLVAEPDTPAENVPTPITLIDIFNEMGRLYADLWNKMEDIHYDLKTKVTGNE